MTVQIKPPAIFLEQMQLTVLRIKKTILNGAYLVIEK